jgi:ABC-2 type transport system permease protein
MIRTILYMNWLTFRRDRIAVGLTLLMPIVFFSIFAVIFGAMGRGNGSGAGPTSRFRVLVVDEDHTEMSARFVRAIDAQESIEIRTAPNTTDTSDSARPYTRDEARTLVRTHDRHPVAVVIPRGFGDSFANFAHAGEPVELLYNPANPIAYQAVGGLLQAAAMQAAPDALMDHGLTMLESAGGMLTDTQRNIVARFKDLMRASVGSHNSGGDRGEPDPGGGLMFGDGAAGLVKVRATNVQDQPPSAGENAQPRHSIVAYYAAGIAVMFLLFSMAGAGGSLLDEQESGTLERVLSSNVSMTTLLTANWCFFWLLGVFQVTVMFIWGAVVFGLELWTPKHLAGFAVMTGVTVAAAAGFGILLASLCRSRAQLQGLSTILILIMSALGGSMVPRFVMPAFMETTSKFTFNGWALDGYLKVFWYNEPGETLWASLLSLTPECAVLAGMAVVFLTIARLAARRWETV